MQPFVPPARIETLLQAPISPECWVRVEYIGPMTAAALDRLIEYLTLTREVYLRTTPPATQEADHDA